MSAPISRASVRLDQPDVIVIGAGVSGLTAAALLAQRGLRVQVLERHIVPGGCASFYQRGGYRFDVGATLVSGFGSRGVHRAIFERLGVRVEATPVEPSMVVHVAGDRIVRYGDGRWPQERRRAFGEGAEGFWRTQEAIADRAWDFSTRFPALPSDLAGIAALGRAFRPAHLPLIATLGRTIADIMPPDASPKLRAFLDAQLLITAQAGAAETDLAYGATALDLAREGTFHLADGVSGIAVALARAVRTAGSEIAYGTSVTRIMVEHGRVAGVELPGGEVLRAPRIVAAVPLHNVAALLGPAGAALAARIAPLPQRWGAFMAYVGLPPRVVPDDFPLHHQVVLDECAPGGEGNTTFFSFSAPGEERRARGGGRAVTISTHTDVAIWERAQAAGRYEALKADYTQRLRRALDFVLPGAWAQAALIEAATPATFAAFTGRYRGLVGGSPQTPATAGLRALSHASGVPGLVLCGDTVFPGQSTVGASLSGMVAAGAAHFGRG